MHKGSMRKEKISRQLFENISKGANEYTNQLVLYEEIEELVSDVYLLYASHKDWETVQYYKALYEKSEVEKKIKSFIEDMKAAPGIVVSFGTSNHRELIVVGNMQELGDNGEDHVIEMQKNSIFDLASVTKLFTGIMVLWAVEKGYMKLTDKITDLDSRFLYLEDVTVEQLLSFQIPLRTDGRLDDVTDMQLIENMLFHIKPDYSIKRLYSDMPPMVLKYVLEKATQRSFYDLVRRYIIEPCHMTDTDIIIPEEKLDRAVSNNFERQYVNGSYTTISDIKKGLINDTKARHINRLESQLHGHAGLFSTAEDMTKLIEHLMQGSIISKELLAQVGINRTGKKLEDGSFSQFHGYLCYSKNPVQENSEVYHLLSGNAFALGGYTGTQITIDVENDVFFFMGSNRCHNRVTRTDDETKSGEYMSWDDGNQYICNKRYAFERDEYTVHPCLRLALQYRILEQLLEGEEQE